MSSIDVNHAPAGDGTQGDHDLGPLAWVLDELRKSLDGAVKAMRRFVRDAEAARESDLASLDAGSLRIARQQLHQACGALEMVGMAPPALVLRAMESAVQKFVQRPETCSDDAAAVIERASFALVEYLETVLAGKISSAVALFPQYRDVQALAGADRVHPADLWPVERRFREPEGAIAASPLPYGPDARARLDSAVLKVVKSGDLKAARSLKDTCLGLAASQTERQSRAFWRISAGFFEAFGAGLLNPDLYAKRVASRVLMQYASLAKGDDTIADRLVQDLLFFCSQARPAPDNAASLSSLVAVRQAFSLDRFDPVDYETPRFGRFDPTVLAQARKRIGSATETWSALAGGDRNKLKPASDQFSLVCDSLRKLHPGSESLAQALTRALDSTSRSGEPPSAALAMEVATSVLYLQAAFEELDTAEEQLQARATRLAQRLDAVVAGAEPEPLEQWMEELYRRVSDNQTMGSVVDELRATLGEAEKSLDLYFRSPQDTTLLAPVPGHLAQMRGVLSVLGLDQASLAVVRMRDTVERLLINEITEVDRQPAFEKLGNSLGALGFLIDMLSYQRAMARKLFVFDEELGELRILMGKTRSRASDGTEGSPPQLDVRAATPLPDVVPRFPAAESFGEPTDFASLPEFDFGEPVAKAEEAAPLLDPSIFDSVSSEPSVAPPASSEMEPLVLRSQAAPAAVQLAVRPLEVEDELLDVFLEEAREVVVNGLAAIEQLHREPGDLGEQTTLRRAFHTLKGSSRMVGLNDFGEAAWSMEQLLNAWLAEQKPVQLPLLTLSAEAMRAFSQWADDIAQGTATTWSPEMFRRSADAMRTAGEYLPLANETAGAVAVDANPAAADAELPSAVQGDVLTSSHSDDASREVIAAAAAASTSEAPSTDGADVTAQDFESTHIFDTESEVSPAAGPSSVTVAEDIDFSAFSAALGEPAPTLAVDSSSADFVLDLELPDLLPSDATVHESTESWQTSDADSAALQALQTLLDTPATPVEPLLSPTVDFTSTPDIVPIDAAPIEVAELDIPSDDDAVKVIDSLRISIPLYNVYLNEADEWSRRLATSLQEWALELHQPLPEVSVAFAHSLAGSSATVGFTALSELARQLEHALQHVQFQSGGTAEQAHAFTAAAEDIRRLLHQFAAGFLKEPHRDVVDQLRQILETEVDNTLSPPEDDEDAPFGADVSVPAPPTADETVNVVPSSDPVPASEDIAAAAPLVAAEFVEPEPLPETVSELSGMEPADAVPSIPAHAVVESQPALADASTALVPEFAADGEAMPPAVVPGELDTLEMLLAPAAAEAATSSEASAVADLLEGSALPAMREPYDVTDLLSEAADAPVRVAALEEVSRTTDAVDPTEVAPALSFSSTDLDHDRQVDDAIALAVAMGSDVDDDIDAIDVIDPDLFPIFEEEAAELLPQLGGALRQWASRPDNLGARSEVLRALHTLKGSSRLAGAMRLGEMAHRLESAIEQLDVDTVTSDQIEPLQGSFDGLQANFEALRAIGQTPADTVVALPLDVSRGRSDMVEPAAQAGSGDGANAPVKPSASPVRLPAASQLEPLRAAASQSVRVRAQLLDRLVNQAGEVMISRSRLDVRLGQFRTSLNDLSGNLDRLRQHLRDIEVQAESQMQSRLALSKDSAAGFDPLEFDRFTRVQELTRMMAESVNDVATVQRNLQRAMEGAEDDLIAQGRQARELQRDLLRTRMVEFEGISERLYAVVRLASKESGKQIKLDITGGSIEMDRGVLDRMTPAFEHLLRNCVGHGIEEPQVRTAAGKPATGTITIGLHHEGNDVSVEFRDDGAGLNVPRIRDKAIAQGLIAPDAQISNAEAANLIFMPGFSTATEVTGLSGRGIGMDVVRSEINALGGRIEVSTEAGQGSSFRMVLPLTTAVTQVVMLRAGELAVGVPASVVEIVRRTSAAELQEAYRTGIFDDGTEQIPFFWAGALLQSSTRSHEPGGKTRPVVIFRSASQRIAMHVDEVLGNQEVVVKNLGPQLSRLPGLAGMSVLASGAVVLIYNPVALSTVYGEQVRTASLSQPPVEDTGGGNGAGKGVVSSQLSGASQVPLILVVDDSITVRRVTQRLLQREGYRVALAADGLQALERLQDERPTVVLSDIEMPRMDGFDLARNIRADGALRGLPIIMITSRIAEKHREHAMELGVNHYLGKPYSDEELLSLIQHYARIAASVEA